MISKQTALTSLANYISQESFLEPQLTLRVQQEAQHQKISDEPIVRFVDHIIQNAIQQSASDIHIEPYESFCRIRYRQDGVLYQIAEIPINLCMRVISRLKIMAKLD